MSQPIRAEPIELISETSLAERVVADVQPRSVRHPRIVAVLRAASGSYGRVAEAASDA
jgi:hypothetical protein